MIRIMILIRGDTHNTAVVFSFGLWRFNVFVQKQSGYRVSLERL